jgi:hypothetical protein
MRLWTAVSLTSASGSVTLKCWLEAYLVLCQIKLNQPTKTMGDKSPKANQKKKAQKNAKTGNSSQAKKPDGPKK